jgi:hypothetical protein
MNIFFISSLPPLNDNNVYLELNDDLMIVKRPRQLVSIFD